MKCLSRQKQNRPTSVPKFYENFMVQIKRILQLLTFNQGTNKEFIHSNHAIKSLLKNLPFEQIVDKIFYEKKV